MFDALVYANRREQRTCKWCSALLLQVLNWAIVNSFVMYRWDLASDLERTQIPSSLFRYKLFEKLLLTANVNLNPPQQSLISSTLDMHLPVPVQLLGGNNRNLPKNAVLGANEKGVQVWQTRTL